MSTKRLPRFNTTWRFALQLVIVVPLIVAGTAMSARWVMLHLEDSKVSRYQVPPTKLIEVAVVERLLMLTPPNDWERELDNLNREFVGESTFRLVPTRDRETFANMPADKHEALLRGEPVITRSEMLRANDSFTQFQRIKGSDLVLVIQLVPQAFYSASELSFMRLIGDITLVSRVVMVMLIVAVCLIPFHFQSRALLRAATKLEQGNFQTRVEMWRFASMYPIARALNTLVDRLVALIESHKALVNAAAHELRTPLTRLRYAHHLAESTSSASLRAEYFAKIGAEVQVLDELIAEMLFYARLDRPEAAVAEPVAFDAAAWLTARVHEARELAAAVKRDVTIKYTVTTPKLIGDPVSLGRLVANLLGNAVRHARSQIEITATLTNDEFALIIEDDGDGIPPEDRQRVFEPFVRLDVARTRGDIGGTGLGLAIVERIAVLHGGRTSIADSDLGGARITVAWPASRVGKTSPSPIEA